MDEPHVFCEGSDGEFRPLVVELFADEPCGARRRFLWTSWSRQPSDTHDGGSVASHGLLQRCRDIQP